MLTTITVGGAQPYDVTIGHNAIAALPDTLGDNVRQVLLMHAAVLAETASRAADALTSAGFIVHTMATPDGEAAKTVAVAAQAWEQLGRNDFTRSDAVIGVGGGAVTDLAGFVAATWLRGVRVVQVPTTLLAMVDAAVGGKTGINTGEGKNLVGSFHPPAAVLCDLDVLQTLPSADLRAGLAEAVKCGFIADPAILELVEKDAAAVVTAGSDAQREVIERAVRVKADVVAHDLRESWLREILNYGHTLGHAIELDQSYRWRHGDAVGVGMVFAAELARRTVGLDEATVDRHVHVMELLGLPISYSADRWPQLLGAMRRDKKARGAVLRFVVLDGLASPQRLEGPSEDVLRASFDAVAVRH